MKHAVGISRTSTGFSRPLGWSGRGRRIGTLILLVLAGLLAGCGGGSGAGLLTQSSQPPGNSSPAPVTTASGSRYLLRCVDPAVTNIIADRHGLAVVSDDHGVALVVVPDGVSVDATFADVTADTDVLDFEPDSKVNVPETNGVVQQSTAGLLDQVPPPSATTYFGTQVLGAYLAQPAASLIRLNDVQSVLSTTGVGMVAIIDTGVDPNHPALAGSLVPGFDFVHQVAGSASEWTDLDAANAAVLTQSTAGLLDKNNIAFVNQSTAALLDQSTAGLLDTTKMPAAFGHGTMVAGVVHLAAPTAKIMPLKAFRSDGTAQLFDIVRAIYYAADNGASVINMSFSLLAPSKELERAVGYASDRGAISVGSAGNTANSTIMYPAVLSKVIGVASTSNQDALSSFSNFGLPIVLAAPGEAIVTTYPGQNYALAWGTSFSAPFVSGGTSLLFQAQPLMGLSNARKFFEAGTQVSNGLTRLDLYQAVQSAQASTSVP